MTTFYHPYQFIPATGKINNKSSARTSFQAVKEGRSPVRHDLWYPGGLSGEIVCRLSTVSPIFVGAQHDGVSSETVAKTVPHFKLPVNGKDYPAIPANSLRGMISQCIETLSQSTLRVLEDKTLSVRKSMPKKGAAQEDNDLLYGLGLIREMPVTEHDDSGFGVLPLAVSTELEMGDRNDGAAGVSCNEKLPWMSLFNGRKLGDCLPVYVDGYNEKNGLTDTLYVYKPEAYPSPNPETFYYAKLSDTLKQVRVGDKFNWTAEMRQSVHLVGKRLLAQKHHGFLSGTEYQALAEDQKRLYTRGVMRVLDMDKYKSEIPYTKNKELFLPFPEYLEDETSLLPIPKSVSDTFNALAAESAARGKDKDLPVRLKGYADASLAENRLFYFACDCEVLKPDPVEEPQESKTAPPGGLLSMIQSRIKNHESAEPEEEPEEQRVYTVSEISMTALWRKRIPESLYAFFNNHSERAHLTPWRDEEQQVRPRDLTPAETLLGFVSDGTLEGSKVASALASRVRFSDGLLTNADQEPDYYRSKKDYVLKILDSPKPPSPSMYFSDIDDEGRFISKTALTPEKHRANGFKYYLHHPKACQQNSIHTPWETANAKDRLKQKVNIRPVRQGIDFSFTVSFENLDNAELELLLTGLNPGPNTTRHLGMGKPLGLGSASIDVAGVYFIDRSHRYETDNLFAPRFHKGWVNSQDNPVNQSINANFIRQTAEVIPLEDALENQKNSDHDKLIDRVTHQLLSTLMQTDAIPHDSAIHYPLTEGQKEESEGFNWFVKNDKATEKKQMLGTVTSDGIPVLTRHSD